MTDHSRLEDLRRRVEKDPSSIAFAQLAEEYRRGGQLAEAVDVCRAGLGIHPGYLSARVTLGRALIELNHLDEAQQELEHVLHSAPENLAAIRGLAEIHHRRGHLADALTQYEAALSIARNDPDLERTVEELARQVAPQRREEPANALSLEQMHEELLTHAAVAATPQIGSLPREPGDAIAASRAAAAAAIAELTAVVHDAASQPAFAVTSSPEAGIVEQPLPVTVTVPATYNAASHATDRAERTIAALTGWLEALHASRTNGRP